jgi:hypothetical protein
MGSGGALRGPQAEYMAVRNADKALTQAHDTLLLSPLMYGVVTVSTQRDQVLLGVASGLSTKLLVMNLKILPAATRLATPSVPLQHLSTELFVPFRIQSYAWLLWPKLNHYAW